MRFNDLMRGLLASKSLGKTAAATMIAIGAGVATPAQLATVSRDISPALSQRDNYTMPHRTCNSTSNTMFLNMFRVAAGKSKVSDDVFLASVLKRGDTIYHEVQTNALNAYGLSTVWDTSGSTTKLFNSLEKGYPVVVNILHRGSLTGVLRGGHVIMLRSIDYTKGTIEVSDPYGLLASNYRDGSTLNYRIRISEFERRWQGGARYLTPAQAKRLNLNDYN